MTIKNLTVMDIDEDKNLLLVKGLVPGPRKGLLLIKKVGEESQFIPLMKKGEKEIKETEEEKKARLKKEEEAKERLKEAKETEEATEEKSAKGEGESNGES